MKIQVNGQNRTVTETTTLRELIAQFQLSPDKVAVEVNRRLVRAEGYDQLLKEGDEVELVTFVGGG